MDIQIPHGALTQTNTHNTGNSHELKTYFEELPTTRYSPNELNTFKSMLSVFIQQVDNGTIEPPSRQTRIAVLETILLNRKQNGMGSILIAFSKNNYTPEGRPMHFAFNADWTTELAHSIANICAGESPSGNTPAVRHALKKECLAYVIQVLGLTQEMGKEVQFILKEKIDERAQWLPGNKYHLDIRMAGDHKTLPTAFNNDTEDFAQWDFRKEPTFEDRTCLMDEIPEMSMDTKNKIGSEIGRFYTIPVSEDTDYKELFNGQIKNLQMLIARNEEEKTKAATPEEKNEWDRRIAWKLYTIDYFKDLLAKY